MDVSLAAWLVIALAVAAANLPFMNERLFGVIALKGRSEEGDPHKSLWLRLLELLVLYVLVGALARLLESNIGGSFAQGWEFYAVTVPLFLVLAFPGFVLRYLRRHHT
ncbi:MAG TPA: DUF2818 family protein [Ramlibacter sp.]|nr:DUF2818 family protein [Ramlibacter sp.]